MTLTLVLGGTRSGKSEVAEQLAAELANPVTYLATGVATDDAMAARIAAHRARRPPDWETVDVDGDLARCLRAVRGTALVDSLGTWLARDAGFDADGPDLCAALRERQGDSVVVSEEVGLGVHAPTEVGRQFADALGQLNRDVAAAADRVLLVVAGRVLTL